MIDKIVGTTAEAADHHGGAVAHAGHGVFGAGNDLVDHGSGLRWGAIVRALQQRAQRITLQRPGVWVGCV